MIYELLFKKKTIILATLALGLIGSFLLISSYGFVVIEASPEGSAEIQRNGEEQPETLDASSRVKKLIRRGDYDVLVTSGAKSSYHVVQTKGYFQSVEITPKLSAERDRTFVGNNPENCMLYTGEILYSHGCDLSFQNLKSHTPANDTTPTTATPITENDYAFPIIGMLRIAGVPSVIVGVGDDHGGEKLLPNVRTLANPTVVDVSKKVTVSTDSESYKAKELEDGFVLYDENLSDIKIYRPPFTQGESAQIDSPTEKDKVKPVALDTQGTNILTSYSDNAFGEKTTQDSDHTKKGKTIVFIYDGRGTKRLDFPFVATKTFLCSKLYVCMISGSTLYIADGAKGPAVIAKIDKVDGAFSAANYVALVKNQKLTLLDPSTRQGSVAYDFGKYRYCGGQPHSGNSFLICIINQKQGKSALLITDKEVTHALDKSLSRFYEASFIKDVSPYKNHVFVVPETGDPIYDAGRKSYVTDPAILAETAQQINRLVVDTKIDTNIFKVINSAN